jgi:hypothetical protein
MTMDYPTLKFSPESQNGRLYQRLQSAPIRNYEIHRELGILVHTRRTSEIRKALEPYGMDVLALRVGKGLWQYQLVP